MGRLKVAVSWLPMQLRQQGGPAPPCPFRQRQQFGNSAKTRTARLGCVALPGRGERLAGRGPLLHAGQRARGRIGPASRVQGSRRAGQSPTRASRRAAAAGSGSNFAGSAPRRLEAARRPAARPGSPPRAWGFAARPSASSAAANLSACAAASPRRPVCALGQSDPGLQLCSRRPR